MRLSLAIAGVASLLAISRVADARPDAKQAKQDPAALAQLDAAYQPTGKATAGADRTRQACADAAALQTAAAAISVDHAPATAAIDDDVWHLMATRLRLEIKDLVDVCQAADHRLKLGTKVLTADGVAASLDNDIRALIDAAKPRDLPPAMKKFQTTMQAMRPAGKQLCAQHGKLAKLMPQLATPLGAADAAKWQHGHASLSDGLDELKQFVCGSRRHAVEEISGSLAAVHEDYFKLVLLVPPRG